MTENRIQQFEIFLSEQQCRLTHERRIIAEVAFQMQGPISSDKVYKQILTQLRVKSISRSAVYRTMSFLTEAGLVRLQDDPDNPT